MKSILIKGGTLINEGKQSAMDIFIKNGRIESIAPNISRQADVEINAEGKLVLPGVIDDQVHFREPGLTHKASIATEATAAVVGGVTSFMEMPNTQPTTTTQDLLAQKYARAAQVSLANYSFFMGATNDNLDEVLQTNPNDVCGIKVFMGSSTGNMLVDEAKVLEKIFANAPTLVATHCEDEAIIRENTKYYLEKYGETAHSRLHSDIRSVAACLKSSSFAVDLAKKHHTRLHILHISTADELALFDAKTPLAEKRITSEVCVHHLYFQQDDYEQLGTQIKCNPAIKPKNHRTALFEALLDDRLDIIATDHAPHTWHEKQQNYWKAPSGLPLVQHSLNMMLDFYQQGRISLEKLVEKMCHAPAICFKIEDRGFLREGYWADIAIVDLKAEFMVDKENIMYQCGWSPLEGKRFKNVVTHTLVSGHLAYENGRLNHEKKGQRLIFNHT